MSSTLPDFTAGSRSGTASRDLGAWDFGARSVHCVAFRRDVGALDLGGVAVAAVDGDALLHFPHRRGRVRARRRDPLRIGRHVRPSEAVGERGRIVVEVGFGLEIHVVARRRQTSSIGGSARASTGRPSGLPCGGARAAARPKARLIGAIASSPRPKPPAPAWPAGRRPRRRPPAALSGDSGRPSTRRTSFVKALASLIWASVIAASAAQDAVR
jgi:hypothetical protein